MKGKTVRTLIAISILSLSFSFFSTSIAQADQCLSQFPDSAWTDGQPSSIKLDVGNLIITELKVEALDSNKQPIIEDKHFPSRGMVDDPQILLADSWILHDFIISGYKSSATLNLNSTFIAKISLTYQGVGCSPRTVSYQKQVVPTNYLEVKSLQPASQETLIKVQNPSINQALSVVEKNNLLPAWSYFISLIDATKASPIQIPSNTTMGDDPLVRLQISVNRKYNISFMGALTNPLNIKETNLFISDGNDRWAMPISISTDRCLTLSPTLPFSTSPNLATLFTYGTNDLSAKAHFVKPGALCGLNVYFFDGQNSLVQVGTLWVKDSGIPNSKTAITNKNMTINCVKGKSTKQVSGIKPSCPKGYKIKK
jgi:hypothetical protein